MSADRARLRDELARRAPWLTDPDFGPTTVDAGMCGRCGRRPRLVATCGPGADAMCRECVLEVGDDAFCDGHRQTAAAARRWASALPDRWADAVVAWWVSTGEVHDVEAGDVDVSDLELE